MALGGKPPPCRCSNPNGSFDLSCFVCRSALCGRQQQERNRHHRLPQPLGQGTATLTPPFPAGSTSSCAPRRCTAPTASSSSSSALTAKATGNSTRLPASPSTPTATSSSPTGGTAGSRSAKSQRRSLGLSCQLKSSLNLKKTGENRTPPSPQKNPNCAGPDANLCCGRLCRSGFRQRGLLPVLHQHVGRPALRPARSGADVGRKRGRGRLGKPLLQGLPISAVAADSASRHFFFFFYNFAKNPKAAPAKTFIAPTL